MHSRLFVAPLLVSLAFSCASREARPSTPPHPHAAMHHAMQHDETTHHGQGMHHRFDDATRWAAVFDNPDRDAWQRPDAVIAFLHLAPDARVADLGAGTGYFSTRLARAVPAGRVYAEDIEPTLLRHTRERAEREGLANVSIVLGTRDDPLLPERVDLALVVDTYHHIDRREAYFARVRERLRPGGRLVIVDFRPSSSMGPPAEHKIAPERVTRELTSAGFVADGTLDTLPEQYVLAFRVRP